MSDTAKLIDFKDKRLLYENLENVLWHIFFDIHAIYEPDGSGPFEDCYMAAVDLFEPGMTFRIYFKQQQGEKPTIEEVERWHFG